MAKEASIPQRARGEGLPPLFLGDGGVASDTPFRRRPLDRSRYLRCHLRLPPALSGSAGAIAGLDPDTWDIFTRRTLGRLDAQELGGLGIFCLCLFFHPAFLLVLLSIYVGLRGRWEAAILPNAPRILNREFWPTRSINPPYDAFLA